MKSLKMLATLKKMPEVMAIMKCFKQLEASTKQFTINSEPPRIIYNRPTTTGMVKRTWCLKSQYESTKPAPEPV